MTARTNLDFTNIKSPVDGIVIDRKVDPGQTVAAQFQTPVMFVVAPDLEKKVYVLASVDEADIGLIREAQKRKQPVTFSVDAYPNDSFTGHIFQVRLNPDDGLERGHLHGGRRGRQRRPQAAARHDGEPGLPDRKARRTCSPCPTRPCASTPSPSRSARAIWRSSKDGRKTMPTATVPTDAGEKKDSAAAHGRKPTYVWVLDGNQLAAVEVVTGLADKSGTEIVSGDLTEGQEVITGMQNRRP